MLKQDADALVFSAKSFAAAMLAYDIALRIGLPRPSWAILTVYIVSQTSAGASLSRGVYRLAGTMVGAVATVAIVPNFVNDPMVCSIVLAGWIGLCLSLSLLDRTPRAYAFVLAGYTASLIGFPSVTDPGAVFDTALVRVQEISLGISCAVLVHRYVLPRPMTGQFLGKLAATLRDARRLAGDALAGVNGEEDRGDRHQLAANLLALQGLGTHLAYDPATVTPRGEKLQRIHDRLARLFLLATEVAARIDAVRIGGDHPPYDLTALLNDVAAWVAYAEAEVCDREAIALIDRARSLRTNLTSGQDGRMAANLAAHLAELIALLHDCDRLQREIVLPGRSSPLHGPKRARGYVYHRDPLMAARAGLGAAIGIAIGCAFWIGTAWAEGGLAVSVLGVCCALFGNADAPAPNVMKYLIGSIYGVAISLAYSFVILPRVTDFVVLVVVLAPALLLAGSLQARPQTTYMALGITLTIPILAGLGTAYTGNFADTLNSVVALFAAIGFGAVSMTLFQTVPVDAAIGRLLRASRRDVRRRALGGGGDEAHWAGLMIDRTALLLPRLRLSRRAGSDILDETLRYLRVGHAVGRLRQTIRRCDGDTGDQGRQLLSAIAAHFGARDTAAPDLIQRTDDLTALVATSAGHDHHHHAQLLDRLIDLRFALNGHGVTAHGA